MNPLWIVALLVLADLFQRTRSGSPFIGRDKPGKSPTPTPTPGVTPPGPFPVTILPVPAPSPAPIPLTDPAGAFGAPVNLMVQQTNGGKFNDGMNGEGGIHVRVSALRGASSSPSSASVFLGFTARSQAAWCSCAPVTGADRYVWEIGQIFWVNGAQTPMVWRHAAMTIDPTVILRTLDGSTNDVPPLPPASTPPPVVAPIPSPLVPPGGTVVPPFPFTLPKLPKSPMVKLLTPIVVTTTPDPPVLGPVPSRARVCGLQLTLQGLTVTTRQIGTVPWFEPAIGTLTDPADRQAVYAAKLAAGDTHAIVGFSSRSGPLYDEPGQPYQATISPNWEANPEGFRALVTEIAVANLTPVVTYDGDDGDNQYGHPNAMRQLPILADLLQNGPVDLTRYVLFARFWDGVFYGSTPENIAAFGRAFRARLPEGYLAIEHNTGHLPVGGGEADYAPGGPMSTYDVIASEFNLSNSQGPDPSVWQVASRLLGPAYQRDHDLEDRPIWPCTHGQPNDPMNCVHDATPPWYLAHGTPRGPYFVCAFEWIGAYDWVRSRSTAAQEQSRRDYLRARGFSFTG